jgi:tRNA dimethylallyltransferase
MRFIIDHEREKLYERINLRVDIMIEKGLLMEVKSLISQKHLSSLKTVGYSELFRFLEKEIDLQEAIELIKQNSRRYAKRQLTWFRKHDDATWIPFSTVDQMTNEIIKKITTI